MPCLKLTLSLLENGCACSQPCGQPSLVSVAPSQLTGVPIVPFNVQKQTALLSVLLRNFPRLALGVGPTQYQVASVVDDAASQTAQVTMILLSSGSAQAFAEVRCCCFPVRPGHRSAYLRRVHAELTQDSGKATVGTCSGYARRGVDLRNPLQGGQWLCAWSVLTSTAKASALCT